MKLPSTITAVYEEGVFKPLQDIPIQEHQQVEITINPLDDSKWKSEFNSLLESIHHHTAKFSSKEIEGDITAASLEVKKEYHHRTPTN